MTLVSGHASERRTPRPREAATCQALALALALAGAYLGLAGADPGGWPGRQAGQSQCLWVQQRRSGLCRPVGVPGRQSALRRPVPGLPGPPAVAADPVVPPVQFGDPRPPRPGGGGVPRRGHHRRRVPGGPGAVRAEDRRARCADPRPHAVPPRGDPPAAARRARRALHHAGLLDVRPVRADRTVRMAGRLGRHPRASPC